MFPHFPCQCDRVFNAHQEVTLLGHIDHFLKKQFDPDDSIVCKSTPIENVNHKLQQYKYFLRQLVRIDWYKSPEKRGWLT